MGYQIRYSQYSAKKRKYAKGRGRGFLLLILVAILCRLIYPEIAQSMRWILVSEKTAEVFSQEAAVVWFGNVFDFEMS